MTPQPVSTADLAAQPAAGGCRVVVMGVSGCGKSSVGQALAQALGLPFIEGDALHPPENIARMAAGIALDDDDRRSWLDAIAAELRAAQAAGRGLVVSCSALKRAYRERLRAGDAGVRFVHLDGPPEVIAARLNVRQHAYMPASLLPSQLLILEPPGEDEAALRLDLTLPLDALVGQVTQALASCKA